MRITATEKNIIIESNLILDDIIIHHSLDECNVEIIENFIDISNDFSVSDIIIFTVKKGINKIELFDLEKYSNGKIVLFHNKDNKIYIPIENKTESNCAYLLTVQLLNGELPILEYNDADILELKNNDIVKFFKKEYINKGDS